MGGYEYISTVAMTGICRGLHSWADNNLIKWIGAGTHSNLYAVTDAILYDITPVVSRGNVSINFTTTLLSNVVTADWTAHGLVVGQAFSFSSATVATVGGVTIVTNATSAAVPSPWYVVLTAPTANQITYTAAQTATSAAGPTASTVNFRQYLVPGLIDSIGALGYSTGLFSTGSTYSSAATGVTSARSWSMMNYGQNGMFSPRGGKIYEWRPQTSVTEAVTNGSFTGSSTGWTLGGGWTYSANTVVAAGATSALSQASVPVNPGSYNLISLEVSAYSVGTISVTFNSSPIISAAANGTFTGTFYNGTTVSSATLAVNGTGLAATIDNVSLGQLMSAEVVNNAPTQNTVVLVTAEGFVMTFGTIEAATNVFNPLHIRWSDIATVANAQTTWTPNSTNQSSFVTLLAGSRIVGAALGISEVLCWTDKAFYAGTFVQNTALVYSWRLVGTNCGLIGPNAKAILNGVAFWMDPTGIIHTYAGGAAIPVKSTMSQDLFSHLSLVQFDKIYASPISQYNDVQFFYPDSRDGNENSRYSLLCTLETIAPPQGTNPGTYVGCFAPGTYAITAMIDSSLSVPYPVAADTSGFLRYHEKGATANGGTFSWYLETGDIKIGDGTNLWAASSFIPDFENLLGGATLTAYARKYPQSTQTTTGPYMFTGASEKIDLMASPPIGREIAFLFTGSASPAAGRLGTPLMELYDTGMAF